jgi:hypothetical protein
MEPRRNVGFWAASDSDVRTRTVVVQGSSQTVRANRLDRTTVGQTVSQAHRWCLHTTSVGPALDAHTKPSNLERTRSFPFRPKGNVERAVPMFEIPTPACVSVAAGSSTQIIPGNGSRDAPNLRRRPIGH